MPQRGDTTDALRRGAVNVLVSCILGSSFGELKREAARWAKADQIVPERLRKVLNDFGSPGDVET